MQFQLKSKGKLWSFNQPVVMGIINVTQDSFFEASRANTADALQDKVLGMVSSGASFIDIGAMSTRPGAEEIPIAEEYNAILKALKEIAKLNLTVAISIDTYRPKVAEMAMAEGADFINDISAGEDKQMLQVVSASNAGYIAMHKQGMPKDMQKNPVYNDVTLEVSKYLMAKDQEFLSYGITSWCADPGFGFGKSSEHNFKLLSELAIVKQMVNKPILAGLSRKGMIYKNLGITANQALNGTTALHMAALMKGADILRVHDVNEAQETIKLFQLMQG